MLEIVDYSSVYFELIQEVEMPRKRGGKFVILTNSDETYAVFARQRFCSLHAHIVQRFLELRKVTVDFDTERGICHSLMSEWLVQGGGKWKLDEDAGSLELFGTSQAYGGVDLDQIATSISEAGGFAGADRIEIT